MTREREVVEISCVLSSTGAKRPALAKDVPSDRQVRLGKINVARRSHSRRQQPIPPLTAACPPRAGAEGETMCGISVAILGDPISNSGPLVVTAEHNRSLEEVGGRPSRPEWLVDQFKDGIALHCY